MFLSLRCLCLDKYNPPLFDIIQIYSYRFPTLYYWQRQRGKKTGHFQFKQKKHTFIRSLFPGFSIGAASRVLHPVEVVANQQQGANKILFNHPPLCSSAVGMGGNSGTWIKSSGRQIAVDLFCLRVAQRENYQILLRLQIYGCVQLCNVREQNTLRIIPNSYLYLCKSMLIWLKVWTTDNCFGGK